MAQHRGRISGHSTGEAEGKKDASYIRVPPRDPH